MSGGDLPPRQKMIGMMYLVLTALLAMNVSKDILDAFIVVNEGIETSTSTFADKTNVYYKAFASAAAESDAAKPYQKKANEVKKMADDLYDHISNLKKHLVTQTDKVAEGSPDSLYSIKNVQSKDNYDVPTLVMGLADPSNAQDGEFTAKELRGKINKFQEGLLAMFEDKDTKELMKKTLSVLETKDFGMVNGTNETWESGNFYHVPLAAVITILSKIQSDVRSAEAEAVAKLYENIDAGSVSFSKVDGFAYAKKAYIMEGDSFSAEVFTAAYNDLDNPDIFIGKVDSAAWKKGETDESKLLSGNKGSSWEDYKAGGWYQLQDVKAGKGNFQVKESVGVYNWGGIIKVKTKKGPKIYPFENTFEVGKPSLAISADKMNVFYIGVDNPVSIAAPMPKFTASAPGLSKKGTGWVMRPRKPGKVNIVVTGEDDNGNKVNLGKSEFRVKRIPDPKSYCGGKSGSESIKKIAFKAASTVQAKMENFDFDIKVRVQSFMFSTTKSGEVMEIKVSGNKLDGRCKSMIDKARKNQKFFIEKIQVKMPDGTTRKLAPIILKVI